VIVDAVSHVHKSQNPDWLVKTMELGILNRLVNQGVAVYYERDKMIVFDRKLFKKETLKDELALTPCSSELSDKLEELTRPSSVSPRA
jgi:hypothetical protein